MTNIVPNLNTQDIQRFGGKAPARVVDAVATAARSTGVDFAYLMEKASVESGYRTDVQAKTSSATGLFQFIDSTWLDMVKDHGAKHGLGAYAEMIDRRSDGRAVVDDPIARREILELRKDPRISALLAGELAQENRRHLEGELGRPVGQTELYMAHFLGAGGATKFLKAMDQNPSQPAAGLLPEAARANRSIFYDRGQPRTVSEIYDRFAAKFGEEGGAEPVGRFGRIIAAPGNDGNPVGSGRSVASALEPLSTFTVMLLSQLAPPGDKDGSNEQTARQEQEKMTPNLLAKAEMA